MEKFSRLVRGIVLVFVWVMLAAALPVCAADRWLPEEDFAVGPVNLSDTRSDVLAKLGNPSSTVEFTLPYFAGGKNVQFQKYIYPDMEVTISVINGGVMEIAATSPKLATPRGVQAGDDFRKIFAQYGEPQGTGKTRDGQQTVYSYSDKLGGSNLSFLVNPTDGKIMKIIADHWSI